MSDKTRILIADDHRIVAEGIATFLSHESDFEVLGSATDGRKAISMLKSLHPDIIILDLSMPDLDGIEAAYEIRSFDQHVQILIYTMSVTKAHVTAVFKAGVGGYVLKSEPLEELLMALRALKEGATFYSRPVQRILQEHIKELELGEANNASPAQKGIATLSVREKEVFILLADGFTVKEIAHRLSISPKTVESHKYNIMDKLNLNSIAEFTKIALKKKLIQI
jgi:DNA-binding NarL/FixJ family response regulator